MSATIYFHVSSTRNRASILEHGLDWSRMGAACGIAGSREPEEQGCFLSGHESEVDWFVGMNNTGGPVDVWIVRGVSPAELITTSSGYDYVPRRVPAKFIELARADIEPRSDRTPPALDGDSGNVPEKGTAGLFFEL